MSWLRIDDAMPFNGKVGRLDDAEFRALVSLWAYCAREQDGGRFTLKESSQAIYGTPEGPKCVTETALRRFLDLGLVETKDGETFRVHDWSSYQAKDPTGARRQQRFRRRHGKRS